MINIMRLGPVLKNSCVLLKSTARNPQTTISVSSPILSQTPQFIAHTSKRFRNGYSGFRKPGRESYYDNQRWSQAYFAFIVFSLTAVCLTPLGPYLNGHKWTYKYEEEEE